MSDSRTPHSSTPASASPAYSVRLVESLSQLDADAWNALLPPHASPFVQYAWLEALESTGCVGGQTGWRAQHVTVWEGERLVGAAPAYLKFNSEGEFVFDHGWAQGARQLGIAYYPKLLVAVPFTPATGARFLIHPEASADAVGQILAQALVQVQEKRRLSSSHILFHPESQAQSLERSGFMTRLGVQFHWNNRGYQTWEDFLASFNSKRRHQLKRERREVEQSGIQTRTYRGNEISERVLNAMFEFYLSSVEKYRPWTQQYLTRGFFERVVARMPESIEIVLAEKGGKAIAGAFNVAGGERLYGRYWGAVEEHPFLHFHVCYYHSIEQCILRGIQVFEPGAGGGHKLPRGFEPTLTFSSHTVSDPRLARAVQHFLTAEAAHIQRVVGGKAEEGAE